MAAGLAAICPLPRAALSSFALAHFPFCLFLPPCFPCKESCCPARLPPGAGKEPLFALLVCLRQLLSACPLLPSSEAACRSGRLSYSISCLCLPQHPCSPCFPISVSAVWMTWVFPAAAPPCGSRGFRAYHPGGLPPSAALFSCTLSALHCTRLHGTALRIDFLPSFSFLF